MAGVPGGGLFAPPPQPGGLFASFQPGGGLFAGGGASDSWETSGPFRGAGASGSWAPEPTFWEKLPNSMTYQILADAWRAIEVQGKVLRGEIPTMILTEDGRWTTNPELIERSADLAAWAGAGMMPRAASRATRSLASPSVRIYDPPPMRPRPFKKDYRAGARADAAGRLTHDIEGRPLAAEHVVGRRMVGGKDEPLAPAQYDAVTKGAIGEVPKAVEARALPEGAIGVYRVGRDAQGNLERSIRVLKTLSPEAAAKVTAHEMGHMIDDLARRLASDPGVPREGIRKELRQVYHDLNDPSRRRGKPTPRHLQTRPEHFGYRGKDEVDAELMAEAIRAYMADPNYLKTVAPKTAAAIRAAVYDSDQLRQVIQFNVGGVPGGFAVPSENEAQHR